MAAFLGLTVLAVGAYTSASLLVWGLGTVVEKATQGRPQVVRDASSAQDPLARYRPWFYAAALYNLAWGTIVVLFPRALFDAIGIPPPSLLPLWQVVGMLVLVYAPGYWWVGRRPSRHCHLVLIGFLGKVLGPLGFAWSVAAGQLPLAFGWTILTNDLLWWPAFALFLRDAARLSGGLGRLLRGD